MFDPLFDLMAGLLSWFYDRVPSYGFAIIALTTLVLIVLAPLTYRSTKSMLAMRRVQPELRRLQRKYRDDKERLNQEMMKLYQEHNVSPLSSCLPLLVQSPVFLVMFRVFRGITRRSSTIGYRSGEASWMIDNASPGDFVQTEPALRGFNPEYLDPSSAMYQSLYGESEMNWIGIDLSRTPLEMLGESVGKALPYLAMVAIVAFLGWYQQRQIAGRQTGEISAQQQMIMRVIPWMLPIFSFTMPAALVLYFMVSSSLRIAQQAYITRTIYADESLTAPIELDEDEDDDFDDDGEDESPFAQLLGTARSRSDAAAKTPPLATERHGSRRPTSGTTNRRNRAKPPRDTATPTPAATKRTTDRKSDGSGSSKQATNRRQTAAERFRESGDSGGGSLWSRAKRSNAASEEPAAPTSKRVTPKKDRSPNQRRPRK